MIYDALVASFGRDSVVMDIDSIPLGADFINFIDSAVHSCHTLLAIIGPTWLESSDSQGRRRLDDPKDFVRLEIKSALEANISVVPVLIGGVAVPDAASLPEDIRKLSRMHGMPFNLEYSEQSAKTLIAKIKTAMNVKQRTSPIRDEKDSVGNLVVSDDYLNLYGLGLVDTSHGRHDDAIAAANEAIREAPDVPQGYLVRGLAHSSKQEYNLAIEDYSEAIRLFSSATLKSPQISQDRAGAILAESKVKGDKVIALVLKKRAIAHYRLGQYNEAIDDTTRAISLDATEADLYKTRGEVFRIIWRINDCLREFQTAISLNPNDAETHLVAGEISHLLRRHEDARGYYNEAIRLDLNVRHKVRMSKEYLAGNTERSACLIDEAWSSARAFGWLSAYRGLAPRYRRFAMEWCQSLDHPRMERELAFMIQHMHPEDWRVASIREIYNLHRTSVQRLVQRGIL